MADLGIMLPHTVILVICIHILWEDNMPFRFYWATLYIIIHYQMSKFSSVGERYSTLTLSAKFGIFVYSTQIFFLVCVCVCVCVWVCVLLYKPTSGDIFVFLTA